MAYMISDDCASCAACVEACPNQAISEGQGKYDIDPDKCTECLGFFDEPQCAAECPSGACIPDPDRQETKEQLAAKYAKLHPNRPLPK